VDERGMDGHAAVPSQAALASWNCKTRERGPRSELVFARRDDGAALSLVNPDMMTPEQRMSLVWERSDRKILSASNHDIQGMAGDWMCRIISSPLYAWLDIFTTLYLCTIIPYALLLGRPLIEDPATQRFGDSANGVQRFGLRCSR
jgi:hypothetical protein